MDESQRLDELISQFEQMYEDAKLQYKAMMYVATICVFDPRQMTDDQIAQCLPHIQYSEQLAKIKASPENWLFLETDLPVQQTELAYIESMVSSDILSIPTVYVTTKRIAERCGMDEDDFIDLAKHKMGMGVLSSRILSMLSDQMDKKVDAIIKDAQQQMAALVA